MEEEEEEERVRVAVAAFLPREEVRVERRRGFARGGMVLLWCVMVQDVCFVVNVFIFFSQYGKTLLATIQYGKT